MFTRLKKRTALVYTSVVGIATVLSFQNCNRFQAFDDSASQLGSSISLSNKGDGFLDYCSDKKAVLDGVSISIAGPREVVWNSPNPNTVNGPIPDGTTTAYRDDQGKVSLLIVHSDTFRITGDSLNNLNPNSTEVIFKSAHDIKEQNYNHRHWLMAPYSLDGKNFIGVNHHEWYACKVNNDCNDDYSVIMRSWANSLTKTVSNDGGRTWSVPENHLILAPPLWNNKPYNTSVVNNHGFFHPTKIVREGSYYYLFAFAATSRDLPASESYSGMIILRTADFSKWQYWTGGSRYVDVGTEKPTIIPDMNTVLVSLTYNASLCSYMAVFATGDTGRGPSPLYFKLTASLANPQWTPAKEIAGSRQASIPTNVNNTGFIVNNYPSVLDPFSAGHNFEITGSDPYVYFNNAGPDPFVRNVYRLPLKIEGTGVIPSTPPSTTAPPSTPPTTTTPNPGSTPAGPPPPISPQTDDKIPAGLFSVGAGVYFSNGTSYCYFPSMSSFTQVTGKNSLTGVPSVASIPSSMKNDGACQGTSSSQAAEGTSTKGLFMVGSGIYYSNGSAYCYFTRMESFVAITGKSSSDDIVRWTEIPAGLRSDGACK